MSAPWWGRERSPRDSAVLVPGPGPVGQQPRPHPERRADVVRELLDGASAYTPDWTNHREGDAGYALTLLFGELSEPILQRLNRLPEKSFVEFLSAAGISPLPQQSARVMLTFGADQGAPGSVQVPRGFQASVTAADGSGQTVVFETERMVSAAAVTIEAAFRKTGGLFEEIDLQAALADGAPAWLPFGTHAPVGAALLIGLAGRTAPRTSLSVAFVLATVEGAPPPFASGRDLGAANPTAFLKWDALDGTRFEPVAVIRDSTRGLTQSGIVDLRVPERWRLGNPEGIDRDDAMFWLRVRLIHGEFAKPPAVRSLHLNAVNATAVRTIRDEVLDYVPGSDRTRMRLSQAPVIPGSLDLAVIEGGLDGDGEVPWAATGSLAVHGSRDRVYVLDAERGEIQFGDNVHGMRLPRGFRHVVARSYQVGGGTAGRVPAESSFGLIQSLPFLTAVSNPQAASGGRDGEARESTLRRGPMEIRTRGRSVTLADYELLARQAPGADVARAHAIGGRDIRFPGAVVPGSVSVLLVSSDRGGEPPLADGGSLEETARWLTAQVAPAGIQVVTGAPRFHRVGVRASVVVERGADVGGTVQAALQNLQDYLHPLRGGEQGEGWPFGGVVRYQGLVRILLDRTPGLVAVSGLNLVVDGVLRGRCEDYAIAEAALIWPTGHEVLPVAEETGQ
ncbi:putative baseplate assembly protein [Mesorhizobium muleiense]|uniref:putative baseplate assembly protein n=1 Tax=Mesorhizobium muleiense TaxID=1004279 RepID=UPI003AFB4E66